MFPTIRQVVTVSYFNVNHTVKEKILVISVQLYDEKNF